MTAMPETDMSDLAIASRAVLKPISEIAESAGIPQDALEAYGLGRWLMLLNDRATFIIDRQGIIRASVRNMISACT